jgi:hypothetical protein
MPQLAVQARIELTRVHPCVRWHRRGQDADAGDR